jgi:hypothetical protein
MKPSSMPASTARGASGAARALIVSSHKVSTKRKAIAFAVAAMADVLQLAVFPAFVEGGASPFEDVLDVGVALILVAVLGFHWRLAFAFALELVPGADLFPTWMAVVASIPSSSAEPAPEALPAPKA